MTVRDAQGAIVGHDHLRPHIHAEQTMRMPLSRHRWTASAVRNFPPDGNRYECVDGTLLVTPAPSLSHQRLQSQLGFLLNLYLAEQRIGELFYAPLDVQPDKYTLLQPDLLVLPFVNGQPARKVFDGGRCLLFCEILSPSSRRHDRFTKRIKFQKMGTECWILDSENRCVERWLPSDADPQECTVALRWEPQGATRPLEIDLVALFDRCGSKE